MPTATCPETVGTGAGSSSSASRAVGSSPSSVESKWMYCLLACCSGGISAAVDSTSVPRRPTIQPRREPVAMFVLGDSQRPLLLVEDELIDLNLTLDSAGTSRYARTVSAATIEHGELYAACGGGGLLIRPGRFHATARASEHVGRPCGIKPELEQVAFEVHVRQADRCVTAAGIAAAGRRRSLADTGAIGPRTAPPAPRVRGLRLQRSRCSLRRIVRRDRRASDHPTDTTSESRHDHPRRMM